MDGPSQQAQQQRAREAGGVSAGRGHGASEPRPWRHRGLSARAWGLATRWSHRRGRVAPGAEAGWPACGAGQPAICRTGAGRDHGEAAWRGPSGSRPSGPRPGGARRVPPGAAPRVAGGSSGGRAGGSASSAGWVGAAAGEVYGGNGVAAANSSGGLYGSPTMTCKASEAEQSDGRGRASAIMMRSHGAEGQVVGKQWQPTASASAVGRRRADRDYVRASCSTYRMRGVVGVRGGRAADDGSL